MDTMISNILSEFKVMLGENEWMDEPSKKAAREKVFKNLKWSPKTYF